MIPAAHDPVWKPILICNLVFGRCRILKFSRDLSKLIDIFAISIMWRSPLRTGSPLTTMYASPIVSTWKQIYYSKYCSWGIPRLLCNPTLKTSAPKAISVVSPYVNFFIFVTVLKIVVHTHCVPRAPVCEVSSRVYLFAYCLKSFLVVYLPVPFYRRVPIPSYIC